MFSVRETVAVETSASRATSLVVALFKLPGNLTARRRLFSTNRSLIGRISKPIKDVYHKA
ncbi:hypothetical protein IVB18_12310 [Bradyrhizobium sp. 186]|uniref:hypothetical protein n=1 Tax=Bradyrhizobium sp. 186 TaxID=2782654 RepID=UPI00200061A0|nr:hypothetical protein [Bradyrhizobium sp. 186]UPK40757.1 hypothetical protein IVB18_12310 [Bradyrhizobium sp. 186]